MFSHHRKPAKPLRVEFIISTDRCMMSSYHGKIFIGFATTSPAVGMPERLWKWIACPPPKRDESGRPLIAPYGLRKIEAALQDAGFEAHIIDSDYVPYYVLHGAKALLIGHHDYFAYGPPSNEWWMLTGKEPVNRKSFIEFMSTPEIWRAKRELGLKIIIGGPAVWQWEVYPGALEKWPVDTLVEGEAEKIIVRLAEGILAGEELPRKIVVPPRESPRIEEIPLIRAPSIGGLVEIMRGCPRGCRFCSVTLRPLRFIPLDRIRREILVNLESGNRSVLLHSEDVPLYGADGVRPRSDVLVRLHSMVAELLEEYNAGFAWSHASLAAVKYAEEHGRGISRVSQLVLDGDRRRFFGAEVGIETGSVGLAKKIMPAKAAPYRIEDWPEIVESAFQILSEANIIPAATFILGLPGETEEDVYATIELIDRLKPYPSLISPMFFVPMGALRDVEGFKRDYLKPYHREAILAAARHSLRWAKWIVSHGYLDKPHQLPLKLLILRFITYVEKRLTRYFQEYDAMMEEERGEIAHPPL